MEDPLSIPAAYDRYNLRSVFKCAQCEAYLGHRPITTRCGHSFCQKCALKGKCPIDACRHFSAKDCPHDIKLGRLLQEIEKVMRAASEQGVWKKRKRMADSPFEEDHYIIPPPPAPRQSSGFLRYLPFHYKRSPSTFAVAGLPDPKVDKSLDRPEATEIPQQRAHGTDDHVAPSIETGTQPGSENVALLKSYVDSLSDNSAATRRTNLSGSVEPDGCSKNDLSNLLATQVLDGFNCDICCHCYLEPMTLHCGHTYCRECLHRCLDEKSFRNDFSDYRIVKPTCPLCRQSMGSLLPRGEAMHHDYTWNWTPNRNLQKLIQTCWMPQLEESKKHNSQMTKIVPDGMDIPLFVCTTSVPTQPTHLQIFEPKYRTMLRRVLRSQDRTFGMTVPDRSDPARPFARLGVLLHVESVRYVQPGATASPPSDDVVMLVHTRGISRFEVKEWQQYHGYWTIKSEPLYDLPDWETNEKSMVVAEDARENEITLSAVGYDPKKITLSWFLTAMSIEQDIAKHLQTQETITLLQEIITKRKRMVSRNYWDRIISAHGSPPDSPSDLSWWLAGVFIRDNGVRMELLAMTNPKARLDCLLTTIAQALA